MHFGPRSREWSGILIPTAITALTVTAVTITEKVLPRKDIAVKTEKVAQKSASEKICTEGSSSVFHPNVYAYLIDGKEALPVPGPTIEIDCTGKVSIGVFP